MGEKIGWSATTTTTTTSTYTLSERLSEFLLYLYGYFDFDEFDRQINNNVCVKRHISQYLKTNLVNI